MMDTATNESRYRLGLDMGTNSIGWAAVKLNEEGESCGVLDMGVRIFPDGRKDTDKTSKAVDRRLARGQRRRRDRYLRRRGDLIEKLVELGLMPHDKIKRKELESLDPYKLRACALDHPLEPYRLGRALFHLSQRRGFKSNRKAVGDDANEDQAKQTRAEISELRHRIHESGARTLGELLAWRHEEGKAVRARTGLNLYPDRGMYEGEFDAIRAAQKPHHGLSGEQWDSLRDIMFRQRDLKSVDPGLCQLEYGEKRVARALPIAQEFRMLQEVNNLRLQLGSGPGRTLDDGERERVLNRLRSGKDIALRKGRDNKPTTPTWDLELPSGAVFNLVAGGRKLVKGDETAALLMKTGERKKTGEKALTLFGSRWLSLTLDERNEIVRFMLDTEDPEVVRRKGVEEWGLEDAQAQVVANISLPSGYSNLSEKAIRRLNPHLEKGRVYSDAVLDAKYPHHSDLRNAEAHERLPYYGEVLEREAVGADPEKDPEKDGEAARWGRFPNPTVHIGLNQLRRVANKLIEAYGKPEEVVVELGRDLKMNREQKRDYDSKQREGGERNERFRKMLESAEEEVTGEVLRKLRLWEEQGCVCPYTGKSLSFEMAVSAATEIDHILPFSKTLDDSPGNKVVCVAAANRDKGNRSPHKAFGQDRGYDYDDILARANRLPDNKRWRFQEDAMKRFEGEDGFLHRQLDETRYLSRTARTYLAHLYDEKTEGRQRVRVIPGRVTALLRRGWGLEGMLRVSEEGEITGKQRDDHRHHAIDAFVVANTTQGLLQRFMRASASSHDPEERLSRVAGSVHPWEGFRREDLKPFLERMVVSNKQDHGTLGVKGKTTGQLHNETAYGLIEHLKDGSYKVVTRKKLTDFKRRANLDSVRDPGLRKEMLELWDRVGGNPEFAQKAAEGVLLNGSPVMRVRVTDRQRVLPIRNSGGRAYKGYMPGGNEFADVWRLPDGRWKMVVVPTFKANQPDFDAIDSCPHPAAKRLMRLQIDDMGAVGEGENRRIVCVQQLWATERVVLDDHNEADVDARIRKARKLRRESLPHEEITARLYASAQTLREQGFRKVRVDEIGRVKDPGPPAP